MLHLFARHIGDDEMTNPERLAVAARAFHIADGLGNKDFDDCMSAAISALDACGAQHAEIWPELRQAMAAEVQVHVGAPMDECRAAVDAVLALVPRAVVADTIPRYEGASHFALANGQWHYINHAGTWQTCPPPFPARSDPWSREQVEGLVRVAKGASQALDDWIVTYAHDMCSDEAVAAARARISEYGTISYATTARSNLDYALRPFAKSTTPVPQQETEKSAGGTSAGAAGVSLVRLAEAAAHKCENVYAFDAFVVAKSQAVLFRALAAHHRQHGAALSRVREAAKQWRDGMPVWNPVTAATLAQALIDLGFVGE